MPTDANTKISTIELEKTFSVISCKENLLHLTKHFHIQEALNIRVLWLILSLS